MKFKLLSVLVCVTALCGCNASSGESANGTSAPPINSNVVVSESDQRLAGARDEHESQLQIEGTGTVTRLLADDNEGSRHQRFIVALQTGQTLLIAHNTDLAPRIVSLDVGDEIGFYGEYEWSPQGGTIHWTHNDPRRRHVAGWLKHQGRIYQ